MSPSDPNRLPPAEPGWFLNLAMQRLVYFDGQQWTAHTAPPDGSVPPRPDGWMARPAEGAFRYFDGRYFTDLTRPLAQTSAASLPPPAWPTTYGAPGSPGKQPRSAWKTVGIVVGVLVGGFFALGLVGAVFGSGSDGSNRSAASRTSANATSAPTNTDQPSSPPRPATSASANTEPTPSATFDTPLSDSFYKRQVWEICVTQVVDRLKAPATAKFPPHGEALVTLKGRRYTVSAYVDSENSFSALLRSDFTCVVDIAADRSSFQLVDLSGLDAP